jgi:hypothetical protein
MKRTLFLIISFSLMLLSMSIMAQDLIVTTAGDSLNCKITRKSNGFIYFRYLKDNQAKATLLPVNKISSVIQAYYGVPAIPKNILTSQNRDYSKWRYGFHGGYSYRTAKVSNQLTPDLKDYVKKLKSGFVLGADVHGFTSETFGLGLKYNLNQYKGEQGIDFKDNITMHYIAASILNRYILGNPKNHLLLGANIGYQSYQDKTIILGNDFDIKGKTIGAGLEAGFEHKIGEHSLLNLGLSFSGATITKIKVNNGIPQKLNKEEYESLSRLELTIGFKFGK